MRRMLDARIIHVIIWLPARFISVARKLVWSYRAHVASQYGGVAERSGPALEWPLRLCPLIAYRMPTDV